MEKSPYNLVTLNNVTLILKLDEEHKKTYALLREVLSWNL